MAHINRVNTHFSRWKTSTLAGLITVLTANDCNALSVKGELANIPTDKCQKYADALHFLIYNMPGLSYADVPWGLQVKSKAATFPLTPIPDSYDPTSTDKTKRILKGAPPNNFSHRSCEEFLLSTAGTLGVIMIHLDDDKQEMSNVYDGKTALSHVNSVLRVAGIVGAKACALHFTVGHPVCPSMRQAWDSIENKTTVLESGKYHMGSRYQTFRDFAQSCDTVVIMGHDATICVHANFFGANEPLSNGGGLAPPLHSLVNVVTSRAVLLSNGALYPKDWQQEYGVLEGT